MVHWYTYEYTRQVTVYLHLDLLHALPRGEHVTGGWFHLLSFLKDRWYRGPDDQLPQQASLRHPFMPREKTYFEIFMLMDANCNKIGIEVIMSS
jgi:hypothetical protein